jgi:pilus assembly protein CpaF
MFGRRSAQNAVVERGSEPLALPQLDSSARLAVVPPAAKPQRASQDAQFQKGRKTDEYYALKKLVFEALIETIDVSQLSKMNVGQARSEIRDIVNEIVGAKKVVMSTTEQDELFEDICNDVLGYGPLEPLLARDDIADIMVNGSGHVFIEVGGKVQETDVRFRDNTQLLNICQRIVSQIGRQVDESSPSATPGFRTGRASMSSRRRFPLTGRRSPSENSRRTG